MSQVATSLQTFVISAAASTGPAFIKGNIRAGTAANPYVSFLNSGKAKAGNLLVALVSSRGIAASPPAPSGWVGIASNYQSSPIPYLSAYSKISDGTETGIIFTASADNHAVAITEWSGARTGSSVEGNSGGVGGLNDTYGPSDAPINATSIPLMIFSSNYNQNSPTLSSPWGGQYALLGNYDGFYAYEPPPNGPASGTVNYGATRAHSFSWMNVWIDPA